MGISVNSPNPPSRAQGGAAARGARGRRLGGAGEEAARHGAGQAPGKRKAKRGRSGRSGRLGPRVFGAGRSGGQGSHGPEEEKTVLMGSMITFGLEGGQGSEVAQRRKI